MSDVALAVPETMRAVTKFTAEHAHEVGLPSPEAVNFMMSVASLLIDSTLVTQDMGNDPKTVKANAMAKMLVGHEMGIQPMASMQDIDIVKNKVFVRYPQLIDQMLKKGFSLKWVERSNERAALEVTRPGMDAELFEFTIEDAKRAGLMAGSKPEYNQYLLRPRIMLTARVASEAYRTTGGRGNVYTPEEKAEIVSNSTMGEPTQDDAARVDALNAQYHVGLKEKPTKPAETEKVVDVKPEPAREAAKTPDKPPVAAQAEPAKAAAPVPATQAPASGQVMCYEIHSLRTGGTIERMESEDVQARPEMARLRAQALCNETKGTYYVMERRSGPNNGSFVEIAKFEPPVLSAQPAAKAEPSPLKKRLLEITQQVFTTVNRGLAENSKDYTAQKTVGARVVTFLQGYMGVAKAKDLPADPAQYTDAFADLESCANRDALALMTTPEDQGKRRAADGLAFSQYHESLKWPADVSVLSRSLARQWGNDFRDHKAFIVAIAIDKQTVEDARASLRLALATRNTGKFIRECEGHNLSIASTVQIMETDKLKCSLDTATTRAVDDAIEWVLAGIKKAEKAPEPAKTQAAPAAPPIEDEGNLFEDLP
jgi:hypothetical protein